jgi:hypothetical protein
MDPQHWLKNLEPAESRDICCHMWSVTGGVLLGMIDGYNPEVNGINILQLLTRIFVHFNAMIQLVYVL